MPINRDPLPEGFEVDPSMLKDSTRCPTCGSPNAKLHPATQAEGEVTHICPDSFHRSGELKFPTSGEVMKPWADKAMYHSEPMPNAATGPSVTLINATPDPLGSLAALCAMYEGRVIRSLAEVTDEQRRQAFNDMRATELQGPLEAVQFHFLVEGVTRAFTHQMVRERQAFFAQESMRFAVVDHEDWNLRCALPPGVRSDSLQSIWERAIDDAQASYEELINAGVPAEDARGIMPHAMTTRLHWVLDLRGLLHVAGLRLCTQAQFEWRLVMAQVVKALRAHANRTEGLPDGWTIGGPDAWQFELIADALKPVCYQQGRCGFMAKFDRGCTIRERVEWFAREGIPSDRWNGRQDGRDINPAEWAADPTAARRNS